MKWTTVVGVTIWSILIILYEWPKMKQNQKKEKVAILILTAIGWLTTILFLFFPDIPGPTQAISNIFKPLSKVFEK
ncbi:hypothetical protein [Bacillus thuringiensis]|uniref:hypothetical protein n=1 Tax=Bacillus thuringiensis TaxID=1428 RepID=UPI000BA29B44|nr:hypothetical protein [Bacillus thuringiensis]